MRKRVFLFLGLVVVLVAAAAVIYAQSISDSSQFHGQRLQGTFIVTADPDPPGPVGPPFTIIRLFTEDGGIRIWKQCLR